MLSFIGINSIDELFEVIPEVIRLDRELNFAMAMSEADVIDEFDRIGRNNKANSDLVCFAGGGAYDHDISYATRSLAGRSEFVTAYTPYQPEVSQGVLQAVFEFQTLISRLVELPITNASLYDGASALVEAVNLGVAQSGNNRVFVSKAVNPNWRAVLRTFAKGSGHDIIEIDLTNGVTNWDSIISLDSSDKVLTESSMQLPGVVVVSYPNYFGCLEDVEGLRSWANRIGALFVVVYDPVASGVLIPPGALGADIAVGEGQAFGTALSFGGPYLGLFSCKQELVRRLPGRLVGETLDSNGRSAYVTTLRAREQDIRREKASSNVCTNQTLMAVTCAIQMSWLGRQGLKELAKRCINATNFLRSRVLEVDDIFALSDAPHVRDFAISLPVTADVIIERMAEEGFLAGIALGPQMESDEYSNVLLVSATEKRTLREIETYVELMRKVIK